MNVSDVKRTVSSFHFQVQVLFEETFFNKNDESFRVLCISQPVEGEPICKYSAGTHLHLLKRNQSVCSQKEPIWK